MSKNKNFNMHCTIVLWLSTKNTAENNTWLFTKSLGNKLRGKIQSWRTRKIQHKKRHVIKHKQVLQGAHKTHKNTAHAKTAGTNRQKSSRLHNTVTSIINTFTTSVPEPQIREELCHLGPSFWLVDTDHMRFVDAMFCSESACQPLSALAV